MDAANLSFDAKYMQNADGDVTRGPGSSGRFKQLSTE